MGISSGIMMFDTCINIAGESRIVAIWERNTIQDINIKELFHTQNVKDFRAKVKFIGSKGMSSRQRLKTGVPSRNSLPVFGQQVLLRFTTARQSSLYALLRAKTGRGDWIRTSDFYVPNVALYQAEPRPVNQKKSVVYESGVKWQAVKGWFFSDAFLPLIVGQEWSKTFRPWREDR
jgi:hypothetical protein